MSNTSVREQVVTAAGSYARTYPSVVDDVVAAIETLGSVEAGKARLRDLGYGSYAYLLDSVTVDSVPQAEPGFDKATAAEVIRAFLEYGQPHIGNDGFDSEAVDALLVLAGIEDEVIPEPEPVDEGPVDRGLFRRLVDFAKGHGFSG